MKDHLPTEQQWREKLTPEQFAICRNKETEKPYTGMYAESKEAGIYHCVCCGNGLFNSEAKFDAGSGWPSFNDILESESINQNTDKTHGMKRIEVICQTCDAHLGHVFEDGPKPTGLRYCINSTSLKFIKSSL